MNKGKICVSVCAETADEMIAKIKQAEEFADVIEVRFDCLRTDEISKVRSQISNLKFDTPLLATFRAPEQGGNIGASMDERLEFWRSNPSDYWGGDFEEDIFNASGGSANRIVSKHDLVGVPKDLNLTYEKLASFEADIIKLAITANDITDCLPVWKLLDRAQTENKQFVPIAMGDAGKWARILGLAHGALMTYASLGSGDETAPGQVTARDLVEVYRVKELDKNTKVFGVIGDPVAQSLSPYMHNPAFTDRGVNAVFLSLLVKNIDDFIRRMVKPETREVELNFGGFSVTMPHKQAIIPHLDAIDPTAKAIGAVNTVKFTDGKLTGYNTDAHGFITPLKAKYGDLINARVAVFGAGGAARACVYALKQEDADVTVFARDAAKGTAFASEFGVKFSEISDLKFEISNDRKPKNKDQKSKTDLSVFDILVDATPLGMKGPHENDALFTADELAGLKFVYDLVTKTTNTPLIAEAKKAGIPSIGGLDMLIAQGCKQFEIWTGLEAPAELMRDSLVERMPK